MSLKSKIKDVVERIATEFNSVATSLSDKVSKTGETTQSIEGKVGIGTTNPKSKLDVDGGIKMSDDTDAPSLDKVGTMRYRKDGSNTYCEMCMQTNDNTYAWITIIQNNWTSLTV